MKKGKKILVSACLLGENCKYSGESNYNQKVIDFLKESGCTPVLVCPEVMGGLPTPRVPAEIRGEQVVTADGRDVTMEFMRGAQLVLKTAKENDCSLAVLKERSPSCGCGRIYDGTFSKTVIAGDGITARLLKSAGIRILGEEGLEQAEELALLTGK